MAVAINDKLETYVEHLRQPLRWDSLLPGWM